MEMNKLRAGVTLGKFAPFHKGHMLLIDAILDDCDVAVVIVYDYPRVIDIKTSIRAKWIKDIYGEAVIVIEAYKSPVKENFPTIAEYERAEEIYVAGLLRPYTDRLDFQVFCAAEYYAGHMAHSLGAKCRKPDRTLLNISGTMIRSDPFKFRSLLHPVVYRSFVKRIDILGAPSCGKTTLARELAKRLNTVWVKEYGRYHWFSEQEKHRLSVGALEQIAIKHRECIEYGISEADKFCFVDTNSLTTLEFSREYGLEDSFLLKKYALEDMAEADCIFVCGDDISYDHTWDRDGREQRERMQKSICSALESYGIKYHIVSGTVDERVDAIVNHSKLAGFHFPIHSE